MAAVAVAAVINTVMAFICNDDAKPEEKPEEKKEEKPEAAEPVAVG
ncbi:MAG: hypothetical protein V8S72_04645 [Oscillospiraceae bacterium]